MFRDQVKISFRWNLSRRFLLGLILSALIISCQKEKDPPGILSKRDMVRALSELYLAEEKIARAGLPYDSIIKFFPQFEAKALQQAGVSDSVFRKSLEYYKSNPSELEYIYTALVDSLNLKAQESALEPKKADDLSQ